MKSTILLKFEKRCKSSRNEKFNWNFIRLLPILLKVLFTVASAGKRTIPETIISVETDIIFPGHIKRQIFYKIGFTITKIKFPLNIFNSKSTDLFLEFISIINFSSKRSKVSHDVSYFRLEFVNIFKESWSLNKFVSET